MYFFFGFKKKGLPLRRFLNDSLAQPVEHIPFKDGVLGSNPRRITYHFFQAPASQ